MSRGQRRIVDEGPDLSLARALAERLRRGGFVAAPERAIRPAKPLVPMDAPTGLLQGPSKDIAEFGIGLARSVEQAGRHLLHTVSFGKIGEPPPIVAPSTLAQTLGRAAGGMLTFGTSEPPMTVEELRDPFMAAVLSVPGGQSLSGGMNALQRARLLKYGRDAAKAEQQAFRQAAFDDFISRIKPTFQRQPTLALPAGTPRLALPEGRRVAGLLPASPERLPVQLTANADALLVRAEQGTLPKTLTKTIRQAAKDNGIPVTARSTPEEIVSALLRERRASGPILAGA